MSTRAPIDLDKYAPIAATYKMSKRNSTKGERHTKGPPRYIAITKENGKLIHHGCSPFAKNGGSCAHVNKIAWALDNFPNGPVPKDQELGDILWIVGKTIMIRFAAIRASNRARHWPTLNSLHGIARFFPVGGMGLSQTENPLWHELQALIPEIEADRVQEALRQSAQQGFDNADSTLADL